MFGALGKLAYRGRWIILAAGLIFVIISAIASYKLSESLKIGGFIDPNSASNTAAEIAERQLGRQQGLMVVLFTSKNGNTLDQPEYKQDVDAVLATIMAIPGTGQFVNFYNTGLPQFVSNDRKSTYTVVGLTGDDDAQFKVIEKLHPIIHDTNLLYVRLGGRPVVNFEIVKQSEVDLLRAELFTFPIVGILLFFIFRSVVAACLPLMIGGTAILGAYLILRIASQFTFISVFALNIITMLGLGLSIDYSLFVISRFREELKLHNGKVRPALIRTMQTAGHTVFFSGLTVIISLLSLLVFEPQFLKSMGLGGASAVLVAMIASLTILPAILALLGEKVNFLSIDSLLPGRKKRLEQQQLVASGEVSTGYWYRISQFVMRRPILVLIFTLVPLLAIGSPFLRINFSTFDARTLPNTHGSRQVSDILDTQFPLNETSPIELVVVSTRPALEQATLESLFDYTRKLQALPGVLRVDSLVTIDPKLDKAAYVAFYSEANRTQNPQAAQLAQRFSQGSFSLVNVIFQGNKFASSTQDLVRTIRQNIATPPGLSVVVGGETASLVDLLSSLGRSLPLAFALIVIILFVLLFLMLGSLVVPLKAVILNILSLSACFGTLVLIFQDGNFAEFLGFTPTGTIDSTQPVLIFAGAFGLSLDYEVFLLSRIKEHYDRTNDLRSSVALGVQKTGGIITSAALLLVVVIGSFVTGEVLFIKQIGLGLAVAILVDATVVRTLLLPASMRLMGKYNWWAPGPLVKLHHKLGLAEKEPELEVEALPVPMPATAAAMPPVQRPAALPPIQRPAYSPQPPRPPVPEVRPAQAGPTNIIEFPPVGFPANPNRPQGQPFPQPANAININREEPLPQAANAINREELFDLIKKELVNPSGRPDLANTKINQLSQLAELCKSMGREDEAIEYYDQSLKLMRETGFDEQSQVVVLTQLSNLFVEVQSPERGLPVSLVGIQLSRRTRQAAAEFTFLANLVEFSLRLQEVKQAKSFAWQALQLAQGRADGPRIRRAERMLASVEAREESQFNSQGLGGFQAISDTFKSMTGQFNFISRPAQPAAPVLDVIKQAETLYLRGKQLQNEKDYYQAIEVFGQALAFNPQLVNAYFNRAVSFKAIGEADKALKDYTQALEIERKDPDIWLNRGNLFFLKRDYNQAVQDYTQAILLNPNDPDGYFNRADAYRQQGQMAKAAADLHKFIDLSQASDPAGVKQARSMLAKIEEKVYK